MKKILVLITFFCSSAYAESLEFGGEPEVSVAKSDSVYLLLAAGTLNGEATELAYNASNGLKTKQSEWKIDELGVMKAGLSWAVDSSLTLNANGWISLTPGSSNMENYSWDNANQSNWTAHSSHPDTMINYANEFDLNMKVWFRNTNTYKLGVIGGYQDTRFSWTANGGYDSENSTNNSNISDNTIEYRQRFSMPYIGVITNYRIAGVDLNVLLKFSNKVTARGYDKNTKENKTFDDLALNTTYYGALLNAGYYLTPHFKIFAEATYNLYEEGQGESEEKDNSSGTSTTHYGSSASIANNNYGITAGIQFSF